MQLLFGGKEPAKPKKTKQPTGAVARRGPLDAAADPDGFSGQNRMHIARGGGDDEDILRLPRLPTPDERREAAIDSQRGPPHSTQAPLQPLNSARGPAGKPPPPPLESRPRAASLIGGDENANEDDNESLDAASEPRRRPPA